VPQPALLRLRPSLISLTCSTPHRLTLTLTPTLTLTLTLTLSRPESFAKSLEVFIDTKIVNMLGGCCGTTPEHIKAVDDMLKKRAASGLVVREPKPYFGEMRISGLEPLTVDKGLGFMNVGERCNIAGSIKFKKLILNGDYDKALEIARAQAESGAQVIDATHPTLP